MLVLIACLVAYLVGHNAFKPDSGFIDNNYN